MKNGRMPAHNAAARPEQARIALECLAGIPGRFRHIFTVSVARRTSGGAPVKPEVLGAPDACRGAADGPGALRLGPYVSVYVLA